MIDDVIRTRRTHKSYGPDPVPREVLVELFETARWAPNHHRTNPWRFRVLGPESLVRLKEAAGPAEAPKLATTIPVSQTQVGTAAARFRTSGLGATSDSACGAATSTATQAVSVAGAYPLNEGLQLEGAQRSAALCRRRAARSAEPLLARV